MDGYFNEIGGDYAKKIKKNEIKNLSVLREEIQKGKVWEKIRGLFMVDEKEILLTFLCRIEERANRQVNISHKGEVVKEGMLRDLQACLPTNLLSRIVDNGLFK